MLGGAATLNIHLCYSYQETETANLVMASNLYRTPGIALVNEELVKDVSDDLGLQIPEGEVKDYMGELF